MGSSTIRLWKMCLWDNMVLIAAIMTYFVDKAINDAEKSRTLPASKINYWSEYKFNCAFQMKEVVLYPQLIIIWLYNVSNNLGYYLKFFKVQCKLCRTAIVKNKDPYCHDCFTQLMWKSYCLKCHKFISIEVNKRL